MFNTHQLTAKIHQLLPQVCAKNNIKQIEVEFDFVLSPEGKKIPKWEIVKDITIQNKQDYIPAIEEPQIRQTLVGLQEVLGENPEYTEEQKHWERLMDGDPDEDEESMLYEGTDNCPWCNIEYCTANKHPKTQAEALCQRWLDGLNPLFDREPLTVLQEWEELLLNLLK